MTQSDASRQIVGRNAADWTVYGTLFFRIAPETYRRLASLRQICILALHRIARFEFFWNLKNKMRLP